MTLSLVVVAKNQQDLCAFSLTHVLGHVDELVLLVNSDARFGGLGTIGNHAIKTCRGNVVGLVHADVLFGDQTLVALARAASSGAVAGIVGRGAEGAYVWGREIDTETPVSTLDSCAIFIPRDCPVRFDVDTFDGFHCCVEDYCLAAAASGYAVKVAPGYADYVGTMYGQPQWHEEYSVYRARLQEKWGHKWFLTT